mgnify:CR=1 FL=1
MDLEGRAPESADHHGGLIGIMLKFYGFWLVLFIAIKIGGTSLASWSWFWVILPIVPLIVLLVQRLNL